MTAQRYLGMALAAGLLAASTGLAFGAWLDHGPEMLMAMIQSGLALCF